MLRSFHYAAYAGLLTQVDTGASAPSETLTAFEPWAHLWYIWVSAAFVQTYLMSMGSAALLPPTREERQGLLGCLLTGKGGL